MIIERGDILLTDLDPVKGSEQGKIRPCLVIQNNIGNRVASTTIVAAITSNTEKQFPFTVFVPAGEGNLQKDSLVLCNQIRTVSKEHRVKGKLGSLNPETMKEVDEALKTSLGME